MSKPGNKRNKIERERDLQIIASLRLRGYNVTDIPDMLAEQTGASYRITHQMVSYEIKRLEKRWAEENVEMVDTNKRMELARLQQLEREAWKEWERSKRERLSTTTQSGKTKKGTNLKLIKKTEEGFGDPRYLQIVANAIEQRRKLLGLDMPTKISAEVRTIDDLLASAREADEASLAN